MPLVSLAPRQRFALWAVLLGALLSADAQLAHARKKKSDRKPSARVLLRGCLAGELRSCRLAAIRSKKRKIVAVADQLTKLCTLKGSVACLDILRVHSYYPPWRRPLPELQTAFDRACYDPHASICRHASRELRRIALKLSAKQPEPARRILRRVCSRGNDSAACLAMPKVCQTGAQCLQFASNVIARSKDHEVAAVLRVLACQMKHHGACIVFAQQLLAEGGARRQAQARALLAPACLARHVEGCAELAKTYRRGTAERLRWQRRSCALASGLTSKFSCLEVQRASQGSARTAVQRTAPPATAKMSRAKAAMVVELKKLRAELLALEREMQRQKPVYYDHSYVQKSIARRSGIKLYFVCESYGYAGRCTRGRRIYRERISGDQRRYDHAQSRYERKLDYYKRRLAIFERMR